MFERLLIDLAAIAAIIQVIFDILDHVKLRRRRRKAGDACEIE